MNETVDRVCVGCGESEERTRLELCQICNRWFCADCSHRAGFGRKFCSADCARAYYFAGEADDDEDVDDK